MKYVIFFNQASTKIRVNLKIYFIIQEFIAEYSMSIGEEKRC